MKKISTFLGLIAMILAFTSLGCSVESSDAVVDPTVPVVPPIVPVVPHLGPDAVLLGTSGNFVILSEAGITTDLSLPLSAIFGNMGVSPITYASMTGFYLTPAVPVADTVSATSPLVAGTIYAADYTGNAGITPAMLTVAIGDKNIAYADAAGRTPVVLDTNLGSAGEIGGLTFVPGLYTWTTPVSISSDITLDGGPNDVWIFQIAGTLTMASGVSVNLSGGALPKNIFWQTTDTVALNTTAHLEGIVLTAPVKAITLKAGATVNGRLLSGQAVTLISNTVTQPAP